LEVLLFDLEFACDLGSHQLRVGKDFYFFGSFDLGGPLASQEGFVFCSVIGYGKR